ncbi:MAG: hypothetical protein ACR2O6_11005 [Ilumatobacteraceae bacterium]
MLEISLLAHQGGWDEILLVGAPIALIVGLLAVVKRRVDAQMASDEGAESGDEPVGGAGSDTGGS